MALVTCREACRILRDELDVDMQLQSRPNRQLLVGVCEVDSGTGRGPQNVDETPATGDIGDDTALLEPAAGAATVTLHVHHTVHGGVGTEQTSQRRTVTGSWRLKDLGASATRGVSLGLEDSSLGQQERAPKRRKLPAEDADNAAHDVPDAAQGLGTSLRDFVACCSTSTPTVPVAVEVDLEESDLGQRTLTVARVLCLGDVLGDGRESDAPVSSDERRERTVRFLSAHSLLLDSGEESAVVREQTAETLHDVAPGENTSPLVIYGPAPSSASDLQALAKSPWPGRPPPKPPARAPPAIPPSNAA